MSLVNQQHFINKNIREMNNYELMVIFTPVLSEEEYKAAQNKFAALVTLSVTLTLPAVQPSYLL